jgi:tetratricopeptide (TPR) repeat protein
VLEIRPDDVMAHNNLGLVLRQAGFQAESNQQFQKAKEIKLRKALENNAGHAPSYNSLGLLLLETGRLDEAVSNFQKAVEFQPEFAAAHCNLGQALGRKGDFENALLQLNQALEIDPGYAPAYDQLGILLNQQGAGEEAIRHWQKALELNPEYAEVHGRLGSALYARGNTADALQHWRRAIQLQPNNSMVLRQTAWVLATCSTPSLRNGNEAVMLAVQAVQLSGRKNADLLDTLAAAYAEAGRFADAALTARRALAMIEKNTPRAEIIRKRISLYEAGKPFRQTLIPSIPPTGH